jgi:hypothetical protein
MILMQVNPFRRPLVEVGPEHKDFIWAPQVVILAQKSRDFLGPHLPMALKMDLPTYRNTYTLTQLQHTNVHKMTNITGFFYMALELNILMGANSLLGQFWRGGP